MWKLMGQVKSQHCSPRHFKTENDVMWLNSEIISECFTSNEAQNAVLSSCCTQQNSVIAQFGNVGMLPAVQPALATPPPPTSISASSTLLPHPPPITAGMVTQGEALWREGEKPHQPRTASAITDAIVRAGFFSGHSTPWKRGGSCCASHSPLRGESLTGVEKPFRSFSERLITWYSSTLHLSAWTEDLGHGGPTS